MKIFVLIAVQIFAFTICFAQSDVKDNYGILKISVADGDYKVYYENGSYENLVDTLKEDGYLERNHYSAISSNKVIFECLEYMDSKGYEVKSFSITGSYHRYTLYNKYIYKEYLFKKKSKNIISDVKH